MSAMEQYVFLFDVFFPDHIKIGFSVAVINVSAFFSTYFASLANECSIGLIDYCWGVECGTVKLDGRYFVKRP